MYSVIYYLWVFKESSCVHWHVDSLLHVDYASIIEVFMYTSSTMCAKCVCAFVVVHLQVGQ
eukprot:c45520_g1_i1 orf=27-209(+)